jgi:probable addiction module antidote protein
MEVTDWDMADHINSKEEVIAYLEAAFAENDMELLLSTLGDIARSKGMAQIAKELKLSRESLYRSLSPEGNPSFGTVMKVLDTLGFQLSLKQKATA